MLQHPTEPNVANENGTTALMEASWHGHVEVVRLLLEAEARIDLAKNSGLTALMAASREGHVEVLHLLLAGGAYIGLATRKPRP